MSAAEEFRVGLGLPPRTTTPSGERVALTPTYQDDVLIGVSEQHASPRRDRSSIAEAHVVLPPSK